MTDNIINIDYTAVSDGVRRPFADALANSDLRRGKRILDVICVLLMLPCVLPLVLVIGLLVRLDGGPVFFRQTRIGLNGKAFTIVKFRSMCVEAEAKRAELLTKSDREGLCFKHRNDPRITPIGRVLRRTSVDEIPQLFNVLCGDMSLVGPRPALPEEVAGYSSHALGRLKVLPGITGLWQVSGRAKVGFDDMVEMDLHYARTLSLRTDLGILFRTMRVVLTGHGAY
jgi:lipopolysaccharide/colanic/teichoic acid biosynthesis glycosyltransferase